MAVCSKCGKEQYYGETFCYSCGAYVIAEGKPKGSTISDSAGIEPTGSSCPRCGAGLGDESRSRASCGAEMPNANGRCETQAISGQGNAERY